MVELMSMSMEPPTCAIGFVLFAGMTQLDLTGPWEVLTRLPNTRCHLLADGYAPVKSASGLSIVPTLLYDECGQLDIVVVPGGPGHLDAMRDEGLLSFLRRQEPGCRFLMGTCTGSLILAAAGLLQGYECTTHWTALHRLAAYGAIPTDRRVVFDRNRATGGGVTAGIDLGLVMAATLAGEDVARKIQLMMEYAPEPPFAGSPATADPAVVKALAAPPHIADQIKAIDEAAVNRLRKERILT